MTDPHQPRLLPAPGTVAPPPGTVGTTAVAAASDADIAWFAERFQRVSANIGRALRGKDEQVFLALLALVSEGHLLLEDVPGVGKTSLARAIAESIDGFWKRVQFTPDLLPSDVYGISVWDQAKREFEFKPGPVFANIVIGDEINRASPKTQSALLEVMEERQVTVDGIAKPVPRPFMVVATQNPIEMEGTYNLPEAQLDRFLLKMRMGYPEPIAEREIVNARFGGRPPALESVVSIGDVQQMVWIASRVRLDQKLIDYAIAVVQATRRSADVRVGASPRGSIGLLRAAQSLAAAEGRTFVVADDVKRLALPVLSHRILVAPEASLRGITADRIVTELLSTVAVPTAA